MAAKIIRAICIVKQQKKPQQAPEIPGVCCGRQGPLQAYDFMFAQAMRAFFLRPFCSMIITAYAPVFSE